MFIVILFIFLGIAVGYNVRTRIKSATRKSAIGTWAGRATTGLIWLLLFMLGIEVGSNDQIILPCLHLVWRHWYCQDLPHWAAVLWHGHCGRQRKEARSDERKSDSSRILYTRSVGRT